MLVMRNNKGNNIQKNKSREGRYANCFQIGQNEFEFVIDFGQSFEESECKESFHTRVICNPYSVNILLKLLQKSVKEYEEMYGEVEND